MTIDGSPPRPVVRRGFGPEVAAALWTPLRLLIRHAPVLFTLAVAGMFVREAVVRAAVWAAGVNGILGFLVFLLAPVSVMIAMILMLRAVRPSLASVRQLAPPVPVLRHLGSVLIPFVAFYLAFGLFVEDFRRYNDGLFATYESPFALLGGPNPTGVRVAAIDQPGANVVPLVSVVAIAFLLRWALDRAELTRRTPVLGVPGAYLETIWVSLGLLYVIKPVVSGFWTWAGERKAWRALLDWWHGLAVQTGGLGELYRVANDWIVAAFPSGSVSRVFVVPITGLVATAVVYNLTVSAELRPPPGMGRRRWLRSAAGVVAGAVSRRFGPLIQGVRAMGRSGTVPIMVFCLSVVALQTAAQWLREFEWALIGPRTPGTVQRGLDASVQGLNDVLTFVLLICVLAAAADGVARRTADGEAVRGSARRGSARRGSARAEPDVAGQRTDIVDPDRDGSGVARQGEVDRIDVP
jgi:hypothetical protein